jgi:hypothetical protein
VSERVAVRRMLTAEPLERRVLLASVVEATGMLERSGLDSLDARPASVYPPHFNVAGKSMEQWAADWWALVFETPVHTGSDVTHPNLDETGANAAQGDVGDVFFLFQTFSPGQITRTNVTIPAGKPILVPILPMEFSNYDTPDPNFNFPGNYSAAELAGFADASADSVRTRGEIHASVDGAAVQGLAAHKEASPVTYTLPATDNILQFFGLPFSGPVDPAAVDGYFVMLQPLSEGQHTIVFGGTVPENPFPLLSDFTAEITYEINVVGSLTQPDASVQPQRGLFSQSPISQQPDRKSVMDLLEPVAADV